MEIGEDGEERGDRMVRKEMEKLVRGEGEIRGEEDNRRESGRRGFEGER